MIERGELVGPIKIEPTADHRAAAKTLYQMYVALIDEGFAESQALSLVGVTLHATIVD